MSGNSPDEDMMEGNGLANNALNPDGTTSQDDMARPEQQNRAQGNSFANTAFTLEGRPSQDDANDAARRARRFFEQRRETLIRSGAWREGMTISTSPAVIFGMTGARRIRGVASVIDHSHRCMEHNNASSGSGQAPRVRPEIVQHRAERRIREPNWGYSPNYLPPAHPDFVHVRRPRATRGQPPEPLRASRWGPCGHHILELLKFSEAYDNHAFVDIEMIDAVSHPYEPPMPVPISLYVVDGRLWGHFAVGDVTGYLRCNSELGPQVESLTFTWRGFDSQDRYFRGDSQQGCLLFPSDGTVEIQWSELPRRYMSLDVVHRGALVDYELNVIMGAWNGLAQDVMSSDMQSQQGMEMT